MGILLLALQLLLLLLTATGAKEFYGFVHFYEKPFFDGSGAQYRYYTSDTQSCVNLSCFEDKASSVKWDNLPREGTFTRDLKTKIAFFTGKNCSGACVEWSIADEIFPSDFSVDSIDNAVSSFIIYESCRDIKSNILPYFYGFVRFFNHPKFVASGSQYYYYVSEAQQCVNLSCYNDKATSIEWKNLPSDGAVESDGKTRIAFFTGMNCTGTKREWPIEDEDFPYDLAMDGIDNDVTSFIIYVDSREKKSSVLPCPWGMELF